MLVAMVDTTCGLDRRKIQGANKRGHTVASDVRKHVQF